MPVPPYDRLFNPTLEALHNLGGSASIEELTDEVARLLKHPPHGSRFGRHHSIRKAQPV